MKKTFLTAVACILATITMSCGNGTCGTACSKEKFDTLSYIVGMDISRQVDNRIMPQLKADYDVIINTINKAVNGKEEFKVGDVKITKNNIQELGMKYLGPEINKKVQAALADSTGKTEVFDTPTDKEIASTLLGADIAFGFERMPFELKIKSLMQGIEETHNGKPMFTDEEAMKYTQHYFTVVIPEKNDKLSKEWLAEIEKEKGVKKTESGILYKIVNEGDSNVKATQDTDIVKVLYTGKTREGKVFDSNRWADIADERKEMIKAYEPEQVDKDNPIEFPLNRVIKGWTEGMKLVGQGGRIILWIPAELAYGKQGAGPNIGANEALCFDVELLEVKPAE